MISINNVVDKIMEEFEKPKEKEKPEPYESPINQKKCGSCGMWEESECICEE